MSPKGRHSLVSCEITSACEMGKTVDFPTSHNLTEAHRRLSARVMIVSLRVIARTPNDRRHVELGRTVEHVAAVGGRAALLELRLDTIRLP